MFEKIDLRKKPSKRALRSFAGGVAMLAAGSSLAACNNENRGSSISAMRAIATQEAMYYDEAINVAKIYQDELQSGKVATNILYLQGKITDKKNTRKSINEYGTIDNPIFLVPGPDSKNDKAYNDADLDGGFVGVQVRTITGGLTLDAVPFDKETMHFTPETIPNFNGVLTAVPLKIENMHGVLQGNYAVAVNSETLQPSYIGGNVVIPGFAPNFSR